MTDTVAHAGIITAADRLQQLQTSRASLMSRPNDLDAVTRALEALLADRIVELSEQIGEPF